jgi:hypothetical protein
MGMKVTDLSIPVWVSNTANGQQLLDRVRFTERPSDTVYVMDFLGNNSVHFRQVTKAACFLPNLTGTLVYLVTLR